MAETSASPGFHLTRRTVGVGLGIVVALVVVVVLLQDAGGDDGLGLITQHASSSYLGMALLVFLDAVCPVFPGEATLNAASTLAAQGKFSLGWVILAGAVGAIAGDSVTAGRSVPGVRFVVNATLRIEKYSYPRFLLWSGIGGAL